MPLPARNRCAREKVFVQELLNRAGGWMANNSWRQLRAFASATPPSVVISFVAGYCSPAGQNLAPGR